MEKFAGAATASVEVAATAERVWAALTEPDLVKQYFAGAEIKSDWKVGSPVTYKGEWKGRAYEDKGQVLEVVPNKRLKITHYSPLSGQPDVPENYHEVTYEIAEANGKSKLTVTQRNNHDQNEVDESTQTWGLVLGALKAVVEGGRV